MVSHAHRHDVAPFSEEPPVLAEINETEQITEQVLKFLGTPQFVAETVNIQEVVNKVLGFSPEADETEDIAEEVLKFLGPVKMVNENENITELIIEESPRIEVVNETVDIGEAVNQARPLIRIANEFEVINEGVIPVRTLAKVVDEVQNIAEAVVAFPRIVKIINESLSLQESILKAEGLVRFAQGTEQITYGLSENGSFTSGANFTLINTAILGGLTFGRDIVSINLEVNANGGGGSNVRLALYDTSNNLLGVTDEVFVGNGANADLLFNFPTPVPVPANESVKCALLTNVSGPQWSIHASGDIHRHPGTTYPNFPDPISPVAFAGGRTMLFRLNQTKDTEDLSISETVVRTKKIVQLIDEFLTVSEDVVTARSIVKIVSEVLNIEEEELHRLLSSGVFITFKSRIKSD